MGLSIPVVPVPFWVDRKQKHIPWVTYSIIGICLAVYLSFWIGYSLSGGEEQKMTFVKGFVERMMLIYGTPRPLALFAHAFTHVSFMHLLGNMLLLWLVGSVLEESLGRPVFILFYLTSLAMSVLINGLIIYRFMPKEADIPNLGASGAIAGVMGLAAFRHYRLKVNTLPIFGFPIPIFPGVLLLPVWRPFWIPFWWYAVYFAAQEVWNGVSGVMESVLTNQGYATSGVAHWAHIGGLLMGVLAAFLLSSVKEGKREYTVEDTEKAVNGKASRYATQLDLEALLREKPNDPEIMEALAKLHAAQSQNDKARAYYLHIIAHHLREQDARRAGDAYLGMVTMLPPAPVDPRLQISAANALDSVGRFRYALAAYEDLVVNHPESIEAQFALLRGAQIRLGRLRDPVRAEWMLRTLLDDHPDSQWAPAARETLQKISRKI